MVDGLTPQTAAKRSKYSERQIRRACEKASKGKPGGIDGAELVGGTWFFTVEAWQKWENTPEYHKTGKKAKG